MVGTKSPARICICSRYTLLCGYAIQTYTKTSDWKMWLPDWRDGSDIKCLLWKHKGQSSDLRTPEERQVWQHTPIVPVLGLWTRENPWSSVSSKHSWINWLPILWETVSQKKNPKWGAMGDPQYLSLASTHAPVHMDIYAYTLQELVHRMHTHTHI